MTDYTIVEYLAKNCSIEVNVTCLVICYSYYFFPPPKANLEKKKKKSSKKSN